MRYMREGKGRTGVEGWMRGGAEGWVEGHESRGGEGEVRVRRVEVWPRHVR